MKYIKIKTSAEVIAVIKAKHYDELSVFGTISEPYGCPHGSSFNCRMMTQWGFSDSPIPLIEINETWRKHPVDKRKKDQHVREYYIFHPVGDDDDF